MHPNNRPVMIVGVPTPLNVTQHYHASPVEVFALFNDPDFIAGRLTTAFMERFAATPKSTRLADTA